STITLTMDRYSHTLVGELADALAVLPDLSAVSRQELRATGTDDAKSNPKNLASSLALSERFSGTPVDSDRPTGGKSENGVSLGKPPQIKKKTAICQGKNQAEGVGFEPTNTFVLPVFKTGAIGRSATPPVRSS